MFGNWVVVPVEVSWSKLLILFLKMI